MRFCDSRTALAALACLLLGAAGGAPAATLEFPVTAPAADCGTAWSEHGCGLWLGPTTEADWSGTGFCFVQVVPPGLVLFPCRVYLDLAGLTGIETVEIDIIEGAGIEGQTRAFLYSDDGQTVIDWNTSTWTGPQTLVLSAGGANVSQLAVSGHEGLVEDIRVTGTALAVEPATWARIKATYR